MAQQCRSGASGGLKIIAVTQQIELSGPVGKMLAAVMLGLAEIELEHIRERQRAGIEAAKKKGVYNGRPRGMTKAKRPPRARELRQQGLTIPEVSNAMGVSERIVHRYLNLV